MGLQSIPYLDYAKDITEPAAAGPGLVAVSGSMAMLVYDFALISERASFERL